MLDFFKFVELILDLDKEDWDFIFNMFLLYIVFGLYAAAIL